MQKFNHSNEQIRWATGTPRYPAIVRIPQHTIAASMKAYIYYRAVQGTNSLAILVFG